MRIKENFTATRVDSYKCPSGKQQSIIWDAKTVGLGLRATKGGAKSYVFQTKLHGDTLRLTIGDVRTWSVSKAQAEATRLKSLTDQGIDPRELAETQRRHAENKKAELHRKSLLVSDAWDAYINYQKDKMTRLHIERGKKWGNRHLIDHINLSQAGGHKRKRGNGETRQGVLYPLMSVRISDINVDLLSNWQKHEAEVRANNARQGFEMFRAFWRWCANRPEYADVIDLAVVENKELRDEVPSRKNKKFDVL